MRWQTSFSKETFIILFGLLSLGLISGSIFFQFEADPPVTPITKAVTPPTVAPVAASDSEVEEVTLVSAAGTAAANQQSVVVSTTPVPAEPVPVETVPVETVPVETEPVPVPESEPDVSPPLAPPHVSTTVVTSAHIATIIADHNAVRSVKGLSPLTWSVSVAASAQAWADSLVVQGCPLIHSDGPYGENLYYSWTTGDLVLNPAPGIAWWVDEEAYYDYDSNECQPGQQCGHYTQIVWEDTRTVGCGVSTCSEDGRNTQMWVCQYDPPGNDGSRPY